MKALLLASGMILLLSLTGCRTNRTERQLPHNYTVYVTGPADATFTGNVKVDGVAQAVAGTAPASFTFECNRIDCPFKQGPQPGSLRFEVHDGVRNLGAGATTGPGGTCHFTVRDGELGARSSWKI